MNEDTKVMIFVLSLILFAIVTCCFAIAGARIWYDKHDTANKIKMNEAKIPIEWLQTECVCGEDK